MATCASTQAKFSRVFPKFSNSRTLVLSCMLPHAALFRESMRFRRRHKSSFTLAFHVLQRPNRGNYSDTSNRCYGLLPQYVEQCLCVETHQPEGRPPAASRFSASKQSASKQCPSAAQELFHCFFYILGLRLWNDLYTRPLFNSTSHSYSICRVYSH